jgi:hypothetical protein
VEELLHTKNLNRRRQLEERIAQNDKETTKLSREDRNIESEGNFFRERAKQENSRSSEATDIGAGVTVATLGAAIINRMRKRNIGPDEGENQH